MRTVEGLIIPASLEANQSSKPSHLEHPHNIHKLFVPGQARTMRSVRLVSLLAASPAVVSASPISILRRVLLPSQSCTGSSVSDSGLVPVILTEPIDYFMSDLKTAVIFDDNASPVTFYHTTDYTSDNDTSGLNVHNGASVENGIRRCENL